MNIQEKKRKLDNPELSQEDKIRLLWMWIKQEHINLASFVKLVGDGEMFKNKT